MKYLLAIGIMCMVFVSCEKQTFVPGTNPGTSTTAPVQKGIVTSDENNGENAGTGSEETNSIVDPNGDNDANKRKGGKN